MMLRKNYVIRVYHHMHSHGNGRKVGNVRRWQLLVNPMIQSLERNPSNGSSRAPQVLRLQGMCACKEERWAANY